MMRTSRAKSSGRVFVRVFARHGAFSAAAGPDSSEAAEAARVFCGYVEARNRHDFRRASALVSNDIRWIDTAGHNHPKNDARLEPMIGWEGVMDAKWMCRALGYADGGRRRLEVINVGANPHTKENLFAWLPDERLLFQGDLFYYEEGAPFPPSGRETMNRFFAAWLAAHDLSPKAIYGVHYAGAAPPEALRLAAERQRTGG
jgi:hypothetical protein